MGYLKTIGFLFLLLLLVSCDEETHNKNTASAPPSNPSLEEPEEDQNSEPLKLPPMPLGMKTAFLQRDLAINPYWNLVSFPITEQTNLADIIKDYSEIRSIWAWSPSGSQESWKTYPQIEEFDLLETIEPNQAYWIWSEQAFSISSNVFISETYEFIQGWNLAGISYNPIHDNKTIDTFFSEGNFWDSDCRTADLIKSVWSWDNHTWKIYFPGDTASNHPRLDSFNDAHGTQFLPLTNVHPGMGIWVNSAKTNNASDLGCSTMEVVDLGNSTHFILPPNTISFMLHAFAETENDILQILSVTNPSGQDTNDKFSNYSHDYGYTNVLNPRVPSMTAPSGKWNFQATGTTQFKLTVRTGAPPSSSTIAVQSYLLNMETDYSTTDVQNGLAVLKQIYENVGVQIDLKDTIILSPPLNSLGELYAKGGHDTMNLFFIGDLPGFLGVAGGVPTSLGIAGNRNGALVNIEAHVANSVLNTQLLGETAAHEMGHLLGLFHTTSSSGNAFDLLEDTPQCPVNNPTAQSCLDWDGNNLMFWEGTGAITQTTLTSDQVHIINYSPIAR